MARCFNVCECSTCKTVPFITQKFFAQIKCSAYENRENKKNGNYPPLVTLRFENEEYRYTERFTKNVFS